MIVDEEQRFGVKQKELLRQLKLKVDVLSLSATPIPRTLQMSLAGPARHLGDRDAARGPAPGPHLRRPLRRGPGPPLDRARARARRAGLLPPQPDRLAAGDDRAPARPGAEGAASSKPTARWTRHQLEETMLDFLRGGADCLVTTTIIESGLDIPSANTLIVERSDQLGLSQAYQIRGRVGRSRERAFAYLLYPSRRGADRGRGGAPLDPRRPHRARLRLQDRDAGPRHPRRRRPARRRAVRPRRRGRLRALLPDDRRGGGRGRRAPRASEEAPEPVRLDVPVDAYLPATYVPFEAAKIDIHRRIVAARAPGELRAIRDELDDRFGPPPPEVENLLTLQRARIELGLAGARERRAPRRPTQRHRRRARLRAGRGPLRAGRGRPLRVARENRLAPRPGRAGGPPAGSLNAG